MAGIDYRKIRNIVQEEAEIASKKVPTVIITKVAKEASKEAVTEILVTCGIDVNDPLEMQNLMSYARHCKKHAKRTTKVIEWGEETMESGKIFKKNFIAEAGKYTFTFVAGLFLFWFGTTQGFWG